MQTVGKTPPTSAVVDVELAAAKVEVTPAKAPFRRKLRRACLFACGACLVAFLICACISIVGISQLLLVRIEPSSLVLRAAGEHSASIDMVADAPRFPAMHSVHLHSAYCTLHDDEASTMAAIKLTQPVVFVGGTELATSTTLSINDTVALHANVAEWTARSDMASAHLRCWARGRLVSGAFHVPLALDLTINGTAGPSRPGVDWTVRAQSQMPRTRLPPPRRASHRPEPPAYVSCSHPSPTAPFSSRCAHPSPSNCSRSNLVDDWHR